MKTQNLLVFDFDGTLVQSFAGMAGLKNGVARLMQSENLIVRIALPLIVKFFIRKQKQDIGSLQAVDGLLQVIKKLRRKGVRMGIISSNSEEVVTAYLKKHRLSPVFDFVYAVPGLFDKNQVISQMINEHQLKTNEVIYVGDEARDVTAAKKAGVKVIAVAWGLHTEEVLKTGSPDWLITEPEEIYRIVMVPAWWQRILSWLKRKV